MCHKCVPYCMVNIYIALNRNIQDTYDFRNGNISFSPDIDLPCANNICYFATSACSRRYFYTSNYMLV